MKIIFAGSKTFCIFAFQNEQSFIMANGMTSDQPTTIFTDTQIQLLRMFAVNRSKRGLDELCEVLYKHYSQRMSDKLDDLWMSGTLDQKRLEEINQMDLHQLQ